MFLCAKIYFGTKDGTFLQMENDLPVASERF